MPGCRLKQFQNVARLLLSRSCLSHSRAVPFSSVLLSLVEPLFHCFRHFERRGACDNGNSSLLSVPSFCPLCKSRHSCLFCLSLSSLFFSGQSPRHFVRTTAQCATRTRRGSAPPGRSSAMRRSRRGSVTDARSYHFPNPLSLTHTLKLFEEASWGSDTFTQNSFILSGRQIPHSVQHRRVFLPLSRSHCSFRVASSLSLRRCCSRRETLVGEREEDVA